MASPPERPYKILFACVGNSARSQMAEGFARAFGGSAVDVRSGGSKPAGVVSKRAIAVMHEKGIDISEHESKGFDEEWIRGSDLVVTMGCGDDACPAFVGKPLVDWDLPDPIVMAMDEFRGVRDEIERRVRGLLREKGIATTARTAN